MATRPRGDWAQLGGLQVHTTGLAPIHWNGAHLTSTDGLDHLPDAARWFAARGVPWGLLVPAELGVVPDGFRHVADQRVQLRTLDDLPALSPSPSVRLSWRPPVEDAAAVQSEAFEDPLPLARDFVTPKLVNAACHVVVAYEGGSSARPRPVATATGVLVDGVVAVFGVGTLAGHRRRGLGRTVTLALLHRAHELGADLAYLNPSTLGSGMYLCLGFQEVAPWRIWSPPET